MIQQMVAPIGDDLTGLRDRALLLLGFTGAMRRSELAAVRVEHLELRPRGILLTIPRSKGERNGGSVTIGIPSCGSLLCPVRALYRWLEVAEIKQGPVFRRVWCQPVQAGRATSALRAPHVGNAAIEGRTVARIIQGRAAAAGLDPTAMGGHSLKRGALSEGLDRGVHPTRLKQHGRHKSYASLDEYLENGDPFETHPLIGVM